MQNRGEPARPLSYAELLRKFELNAGRRLTPDEVRALAEQILSLGRGGEVRELTARLAAGRSGAVA